MARTYNNIIELTEIEQGRFWAKVAPANEHGCQLWTACIAGPDSPYGRFSVNRTNAHHHFVASRLAYFLYTGDQPGELFVCHTCDNPLCVTKEHLFLGTNTDNMQDAVAKGRKGWGKEKNPWYTHPENMPRGTKHPKSKLTDDKVREILKRTAAGERQRDIAKSLGVSQHLISLVHRRKIWKHVQP